MTSVAESTGDERLLTPLFALIIASGTCYFLALGALLPTLPLYVEQELGGGGFEVGLVVGAFAVSAAAVRPMVGRFGDQFGRRTMAVGGALLAGVAFAPMGAIHELWFLVLLRLLAGLGEAAFFIGAATAAQDLAPDHRRGEAASFFSIAIYGGLGFGPTIGEWLYDGVGPNTTWILAGAACVVAGVLAMGIPARLGRGSAPVGPRRLLHRAAVLPGAVLFLGLIGFTGYSSFLPLYIDEIGVSDAGPFFLVYGMIVLAIRILGARIPDRLGPVRASTASLFAIASGVGAVAAIPNVTGLWIGTVLLSLGMSLLFPALFTVAVTRAPAAERSHAIGTFSLFFDVAQGLGAPILGLAVTGFGTERAAFVVGALVAVGGIGLANTRLRTSEAGYAS